MAAIEFGRLLWRPSSSSGPLLFCRLQKIRWSCAAAVEFDEPHLIGTNFQNSHTPAFPIAEGRTEAHQPVPEWKKLSSEDLGIRTSMISRPARLVLNELKKNGYDAYLVGGCVRDLLLKRTPKDFDILTSAELRDVMKTFRYCQIVGRRFPVCHVYVGQSFVEVSSFSTCGRGYRNRELIHAFGPPFGGNDKDHVRWRNCLYRDFTINGLIFDPFAKLVYDYVYGLEDIEKAKVRTIIPPRPSFQEDIARILRGIRIAARLDFYFARETAQSIKSLAGMVSRLDKGRLLMEMNYMLAYGSAEASLRLLWRYGLLDILLPIQAAYFVQQGFLRSDRGSNLLLTLFCNLDKLLAPDKPCGSSLWLVILAFHKALVDKPRDPLVVATFGLAVHNGGNMLEAVEIAQSISLPYDNSFDEVLESQDLGPDALKDEVVDFAVSVETALSRMTNERCVSSALSSYPQAPYSELVFIPLSLYLKTSRIFQCVRSGKEADYVPKMGCKIDYQKLAREHIDEVRHVFARVIFDTVYPLHE